ncbi:MAG: hypothetical protein RRY40_00150 [Oscillospiraceae bacterium]
MPEGYIPGRNKIIAHIKERKQRMQEMQAQEMQAQMPMGGGEENVL